MKFIKPSVEILVQEPGIIGMKKHIERCARTSYKSEDRITDDSYIKFLDMLKERGHWACFEFGTVYLIVPQNYEENSEYTMLEYTQVLGNLIFPNLSPKDSHTKVVNKDGDYYITTNYRKILQSGLENVMEKLWSEPTEYHYHRTTSLWKCSRSTSHQLVRHRAFVFLQMSQRYVNYSKDKFGSEITYVIPQWIYDIRNKIGATLDPQTYEPRDYILSYDENDLISELSGIDKTVASRYKFWKACEDEYMYELSTTEGTTLNPEDARGVLCNDTETEVCMCGYNLDWFYRPDNTAEKAGFFYLRSANSAQRDIRVLSKSLEEQMINLGYDKLK